jgi:tetratricopeptide (TPR) repeat protein
VAASSWPSWLAEWIGVGSVVAVIIAAPLMAGSVHRPTMLLVFVASGLALAACMLGIGLQGRTLRLGSSVVVPLAFLIVPILQSIPLPLALRRLLDPNGSTILQDNALEPITAWPLSLDPASTRVYVGRAAAALAIFLIVYHLSSGRSRRYLIPRVIGLAGVAAVVIGLGHRIFGVGKIYGLLSSTARSLMMGPFVNSNHTAEFLELAFFVCLACSFLRSGALNRVGWLVGALLCASGALATLSRGAVLALAMGVLTFAFLRFLEKDAEHRSRRRVTVAASVFLLAVIAVGAGALGAGQLVDRFKAGAMTTDLRFQLWRQAAPILGAHPLGIGRGAFDRVFPIYRTLKMAFPVRFAFVENEPYQLLIDSGWVLFAALGVAMVLAAWRIVRHGRRDKVEAALVGGLFAILAHSVVDFGLETLGVLLPFVAVLAIVLGRIESGDGKSTGRARWAWTAGATAFVCLALGVVSLAGPGSDDFDALLKSARPGAERRDLLVRAQRIHPADYFYVLAYARLQPMAPPAGGPSPRLRALNRALRLCPTCEQVHLEIARSLWQVGKRGQALLEWRATVDLQPLLFSPALGELFALGAKPEELAAIATSDPARMVEVATFLGNNGRVAEAFTVLDQADALDAPVLERLLTRARLQAQNSQLDAARATLAAARQAGTDDPRLSMLEAELLLSSKGAAGADAALTILDRAAARNPHDLAVQRMRVKVILDFEKWKAASRALEGFKMALYQVQGSAAEAHAAGARIEARLGHVAAALSAYRVALADDPMNVTLWMEFGRIAESAGRQTTAIEAYSQAAQLSPKNPEIDKALRGLEERNAALRAVMTRQPGVPEAGK